VPAFLVALAWAVWLPAAHLLGHEDDHEHSPTGVVWHGLGEADDDHDHAAPHDHDDDHHGRAEAHDHDDERDCGGAGATQWRRWPHPPHGHGSALHFGLALVADAGFTLEFVAAPVTAAPAPLLPGPPALADVRPWAARAPPV
jgi:hypothetical protein